MKDGQAQDHGTPGPEEIDVLKNAGEGEETFFRRRTVGGIVTQTANRTLGEGFGIDDIQTERMLSLDPLAQEAALAACG